MTRLRLVVDPVACDGHGLCHEVFPEDVALDDWGYPVVAASPIDPHRLRSARRAVAACPRLALSLAQIGASPR